MNCSNSAGCRGRSTAAQGPLARLMLACLLSGALCAPEAAQAESAAPLITSFSGAPLVLEVSVPDPHGDVRSITLESETGRHEWRFEPGDSGRELSVVAQPFIEAGVHRLDVTVTRAGRPGAEGPRTSRWTYEIGFVDFVFGRDNLRFGNNATFESTIGTFGEILGEWLELRFGGVSEAELVLLVDHMYSLFGINTGRCYAFSGTAVRAWRWPESLPRYIREAYGLRATSSRTQTEIARLQLDMVFDRFVAGRSGGETPLSLGPIAAPAAAAELDAIMARVRDDQPVAVGFTGPGLHHSMVVFGYIAPEDGSRVDLLVANNWKSGENVNRYSRDAEMVTITAERVADVPRFSWRHWEGERDEEIDRLFLVDVRPGDYAHERADLDLLIDELTARFLADGREIIVVEDAAGAWLVAGDARAGLFRGRTRNQIAGAEWERVSRAYRFAVPPGAATALEVADDAGARVLRLVPEPLSDAGAPAPPPGIAVGRATTVAFARPTDGATVTRMTALEAFDGTPSIVEAAE